MFAVAALFSSCDNNKSEADLSVKEITLTPSTLSIEVGSDPVQIKAEITPAEAAVKDLNWSVKDAIPDGCIAVSETGFVSANLPGTATIIATAMDGSMTVGKCEVTATAKPIKVESIVITQPIVVGIGESYEIEYTILPENATNKEVDIFIEGVTPDNAITLDNGVLTANAKGSCVVVIEATDGSGVYTHCEANADKVYRIGDLYPNDTDPIGIVFYTENNGLNGKIMSLTGHGNIMWCETEEFTFSNSTTDGCFNMEDITYDEGWEDYYPAHKWVFELNNDPFLEYHAQQKNVWYMPASLELHQIFAGMCGLQWIEGKDGIVENGTITDWAINDNMPNWEDYSEAHDEFIQTIVDAGGDYVIDDFYWSSTENADDGRVLIIGLKRGNLIYSGYKNTAICVRAIYAF